MPSLRLLLVVIVFSTPANAAQHAAAEVSWQVAADCATGFQVVWSQRPPGVRSMHDMSDSAQVQGRGYQLAAERLYRDKMRVSDEEASRQIHAYIGANRERFLALYESGAIYGVLDRCP